MGGRDPQGGESALGDDSIMVAIDRSGPRSRLVVADVSSDEGWLSMPQAEALCLRAWR